MGRYGDVAVWAAKLLQAGHDNAEGAWQEVAEQKFADAPASRNKTCPREAFLGLCQAGLLAGVPMSRCGEATSGRNRRYAKVAVDLLRANPELGKESNVALWRLVMHKLDDDPSKAHNSQMDVVLALWGHHLIEDKR